MKEKISTNKKKDYIFEIIYDIPIIRKKEQVIEIYNEEGNVTEHMVVSPSQIVQSRNRVRNIDKAPQKKPLNRTQKQQLRSLTRQKQIDSAEKNKEHHPFKKITAADFY